MANDFLDRIADAETRIPTLEHMLGKGLNMPGANMNAGARKIMHGTHRDHILGLMQGEKAILETGYEIRFGDRSSSVTVADSDYKVVAKISKFSFSPNHHYYLILADEAKKKLDMIERISYHHITETYGYLYNNEYMDNLDIGQIIPKNTVVQKSLGFDEYMNRQDGRNLNVAYMSLDKNMEDSMILSEDAAEMLTSPLIKPVQIMINENDIPLNLYGTDDMYKSIPDIGEDIKNAVLIGLRKEKKEESLYTQSVDRLRTLMMSDDKYTLNGKVIDVNIYCNNPSNLDVYYNGQFKMYYEELQRMCTQIEAVITPYMASGYTLTYDTQKLFANAKRVKNKDQYINKKTFSNIILEVVVLEEKKLQVGDKISNRYGGKGVTSTILPPELMPQFELPDGTKDHVHCILNSNGVYGRENAMQLFELSETHIGIEILQYIKTNNVPVDKAFDMIIKYATIISDQLGNAIRDLVNRMSPHNRALYLESILADGVIHISAKPISESMNIDKLNDLYKEFPFIKQTQITVPIRDSTGEIRYIKSRRPIVVGKQYMFR